MNRRYLLSVALGALLPILSQPAAGQSSDIERAVAAYNSGDYATAIALFEPNAHQGNRDAQYAMGVAYYEGNGVNRDLDEALTWFRKAADSGHPTAMFNLGVAHWQGRGVEKSFAKAVDWWERAAELSDIPLNTTWVSPTTEAPVRKKILARPGSGSVRLQRKDMPMRNACLR